MCKKCCNYEKSDTGFYIWGVDSCTYAIADQEKLKQNGIRLDGEPCACFDGEGKLLSIRLDRGAAVDMASAPELVSLFKSIPLLDRSLYENFRRRKAQEATTA
jgi:hypothetical protein